MVSKTAFFCTGKIFHRKVFGQLLQVMLRSICYGIIVLSVCL